MAGNQFVACGERESSMYVGIEIGGTKLQLGLGAGDGKLLGLWRAGVDIAAGPEGIRRQITGGLPRLLADAGMERSAIKGVGIGFGGPVDDATHHIIKSHQIEGWDDFPLADWITDLVGLPAVLGNDANVAGLAEAHFGAGKGLSPIFYITIGSGIGGGLIVDGEIYRGVGRGAAEIGHLRVPTLTSESRPFIPLEEMASGWAIGQSARRLARRDSELAGLVAGQIDRITAADVAQAASCGDLVAREVLDRAWTYLAEGIVQVITLFCPRRIVIGGGVSLMGEEILFRPLRALVAHRVFKPFAGCYDIVPAVLGEEVVVHGALTLARRRLGR
jgi:glucokinase